jgi:DNA-binding response OmpR family regulator
MTKKILLVDDDEGIVDAVSLMLKEYGYNVCATLKGEETYKKITKCKPDLILLDVLLSGIDGRHICKKLKSNLKTKSIPVVMISAHPSAKLHALKVGADGFLAKPFEIEDLLKMAQKYTKKNHGANFAKANSFLIFTSLLSSFYVNGLL